MKNYFKEDQCLADEETFINNLQWMIDARSRFADHESLGWLFNLVMDIKSKKEDSDNSEIEASLKILSEKLDDTIAKMLQLGPYIEKTFEGLTSDIKTVADEVQKHNSGIIYLKKELDAIKAKLPPTQTPAPTPVPESQPIKSEVPEKLKSEPKSASESSKSAKKK